MEIINGSPGLRVAVHRWPKSVGAGLTYGPIGYSPALSVTYSTAAAAVSVSVILLPFLLIRSVLAALRLLNYT